MVIYFSVKWFLIKEQAKVCWRYYRNLRFALADLLLGIVYFCCNPYRLCRKRGEVYGETPISTLEQIVKRANLGPNDCWVEIGSGRGKGALWVAAQIGCQVVAIEKISFFAKTAHWIARLAGLRNFQSVCCDALDFDYQAATIVYLYGSSWPDELLDRIAERLQGIRVISISAPMKGDFLIESFPVSFPWGEAIAYLHGIPSPVQLRSWSS